MALKPAAIMPDVVTPDTVTPSAGNIVTRGTTNDAPRKEIEDADSREKKINAFLDEFAANNSRRRVLRDAIESGESLEGGRYFQARLKKLQNK